MPKINIPVNHHAGLTSSRRVGGHLRSCGQDCRSQAAAGDDHHADHRASLCEEADPDASSRDRAVAQAGNRFVSMRNLKKHLRKQTTSGS